MIPFSNVSGTRGIASSDVEEAASSKAVSISFGEKDEDADEGILLSVQNRGSERGGVPNTIASMFGVAPRRTRVRLAVYDISRGWAAWLSPILFCRRIPYCPHTSILAYGLEFWWGETIQMMTHEEFKKSTKTEPVKIVDLGETDLGPEDFRLFLRNAAPKYTRETYSLLNNNCNAFSQECARFLVGKDIPAYIREAPEHVKASLLGRFSIAAYALPALTKRMMLLSLVFVTSLVGLCVLATTDSTSSTACPIGTDEDSSVRFALSVFAMETAFSAWLLGGLGWTARTKRMPSPFCCCCCCCYNVALEFTGVLVLLLLEYSASVSLSSIHVTAKHLLSDRCNSADSNVQHLSAAVACAWILCSLWPLRVIFRACPLMRVLAPDHDLGDRHNGGFSQVPGDESI